MSNKSPRRLDLNSKVVYNGIMKTKAKKSRRGAKLPKRPMFENRVRFNWGFHDAAQTVREGWDAHNMGFASAFSFNSLADVLAKHPDHSYAVGFVYGYKTAKAGLSTVTSQPAWDEALAKGEVAE